MGSDWKAKIIFERTNRFQSTLPAWGATILPNASTKDDKISIHAPRMGSDSFTETEYMGYDYFNPRSPHGERP